MKKTGNVILGVCGGIAAYKSAVLSSIMVKAGMKVKTVMTENACKFIKPLTFETITSEKVYSGLWGAEYDKNHISLSLWADAIVIAPATANTIAKIANGFADNLLTSIVLDFTGPVFAVPAMHSNMWKNPATVCNTETLKSRGFFFIGPESGDLAGGKKGIGRMTEPEEIYKRVCFELKKRSCQKKQQ